MKKYSTKLLYLKSGLISGQMFAALMVASLAMADTTLRRTTLLVSDLEASIRFYSALGMTPFYDASRNQRTDGSIIGENDLPLAGEPRKSRIYILTGADPDSGMIGLLSYSDPALESGVIGLDGVGEGEVILMFSVDDIQQTRQSFAALGVTMHREPYRYEVRNNDGKLQASGWRMFAYDPDDRLIEIAQRDDMDLPGDQ